MWLTAFHIVAATLATARLTELIVVDRVIEPLRRRLGFPLTCARCVSVWAGTLATCAFFIAPWLNWPLALAWLYLVIRDTRRTWERRMLDTDTLNARLSQLASDRDKTRGAMQQTQDVLQQQQVHLMRIEGAILELNALLAGESPVT